MRPRTVILFGNPRLGTTPMQRAATLAIDNPPKALVWEDDQGKVSISYNSADYIANYVYPRHGLTMPAEGRMAIEKFLDETTDRATNNRGDDVRPLSSTLPLLTAFECALRPYITWAANPRRR
jgi:hypothetical protein